MLIPVKQWELAQKFPKRQIFGYFATNDTIEKFTPNDLYLLFQGKNIWNFNIFEIVKAITQACEVTLST